LAEILQKAIALTLLLPVLGCSPMESAVLGGASSLWHKRQMWNLEKRIEHLEEIVETYITNMETIDGTDIPILRP
jgi:hypothetical protein